MPWPANSCATERPRALGSSRQRQGEDAHSLRGPDAGHVTHYLLGVFRRRSVRFWIFDPAAADQQICFTEREANDDGFFDVTGLGLI